MEYSIWKEWYAEIAEVLHLSKAEDQAATDILTTLLTQPSTRDDLKKILGRKLALVLGAGPSLELDVELLRNEDILQRVVVVCADGATSAYLKTVKRPPDIIVTDLDGNTEDIILANRLGTMVLAHAHGDNIPALWQHVPLLRPPLLGTTQVRESPSVYNFGGFTDGDRAAFAAEANGAATIVLGGMDLGSTVGRYSKPDLSGPTPAGSRKRLKLNYAHRLLEWLAEYGEADIINCTSGGEDLKGIPRARWKDLSRIIN